jgi:regulator of sirC expression with transglutaminase-like and TPR domain
LSNLLTDSQKNSLFRLLADDDPSTLSLVKQRLMDHGETAVPEMESWLKEVHGMPAERHLLEVLNRLKQGHCHADFLKFCARAAITKDFDLEDASFLLAATEYAAVDMTRYRTMLDDISSEVRLQMAREGNPSEIRALSHVLHEKMRFRGNRDRYYEAENTYLNRVLERKVGVPMTLSLIYLILGKHLDMRIYGIALPGHFIVSWHGQFFDPFNHGRLLNEEACKQMVESRGHEFQPEHLNPASSHQILSRMLMNLARVYEIEEDRIRLARVRKYLGTLSGQEV